LWCLRKARTEKEKEVETATEETTASLRHSEDAPKERVRGMLRVEEQYKTKTAEGGGELRRERKRRKEQTNQSKTTPPSPPRPLTQHPILDSTTRSIGVVEQVNHFRLLPLPPILRLLPLELLSLLALHTLQGVQVALLPIRRRSPLLRLRR
jgi:hypothetical protein